MKEIRGLLERNCAAGIAQGQSAVGGCTAEDIAVEGFYRQCLIGVAAGERRGLVFLIKADLSGIADDRRTDVGARSSCMHIGGKKHQ